nr:CbiQ family ECF transporter T component [Leucobacter coleopterorum]
MRNANPLGSYLPGSGPLHRLRPGAKLLGLFVFAIVVVWVPGALSAAVALGIAALLAVLAGLRGRDFWRVARRFLLIAVPLFAFTMISDVLSLTRAAAGSSPPRLMRGFRGQLEASRWWEISLR